MKKIICDACREEIVGETFRIVSGCSRESRIYGGEYVTYEEKHAESHYFFKLELHLECAKALEYSIRQIIDKLPCRKEISKAI